jgi:protein-tyrosine-phosphatase/predicted ATP-grasp superfamily ATP-dependent carboligase
MSRERLGNVLVVGDNDMAGLTAVRSLGRAGLDVHLVAFEQGSVTRASRHVRRVHHLGHPLEDPSAFRERFLALVRRTRFDLALPTSDPALVTLMPCREEVERHTRLAVPDRAGFTATNDKVETVRLAQQLGIPVPRTQLLRSPADLPSLRGPFAFPLVLKPSRTVLEGRTERNLVRVVHCEEDLRDRLAVLLQRCPTLVQEFCPGYGAGLSVLADRGELVAAFQHERVHEPPQGGAASYRRSVPLSPALLEAARGFCRQIRWTGPAMFEFKVCPETGKAVLMEVNGRLWGSLALAVHAGVDFPRLIYELLVCGRARPTFTYRVPCYVRHTRLDAEWLWDNFRAPRGRPELLRKGAGQVLRELANVCRGRERYDLESLADPLPGFLSWIWLARYLTAGAWRWLGRRWEGWRFRRRAEQFRSSHSAAAARLSGVRSVLFVCHGNINRSAVAEQALRQRCRARGWALRVASAGLLPQAGRSTGPVSREVAASLGVDLAEHRSTPLTAELLRDSDLVLVMEADHLAGVRALEPRAVARTFPLASFRDPGSPVEIADPEGRERAVLRTVYEEVIASVEGLVRGLEEGRGLPGHGEVPSLRKPTPPLAA